MEDIKFKLFEFEFMNCPIQQDTRRLRHYSASRLLAPTSRNVLFHSLSGTQFLRLFRKRLIVCLMKSRINNHYFVGPLTSRHNRLPPAPLKLRIYGAPECVCYYSAYHGLYSSTSCCFIAMGLVNGRERFSTQQLRDPSTDFHEI